MLSARGNYDFKKGECVCERLYCAAETGYYGDGRITVGRLRFLCLFVNFFIFALHLLLYKVEYEQTRLVKFSSWERDVLFGGKI